jgi:signal peptidase I
MTTFMFLGAFALLLVASVAANSLFLQIGSRWAKIPNVSYRRAVLAIIAAGLVSAVPGVIVSLLERIPVSGLGGRIAILATVIVTSFVLPWLIIAWVLRTKVWRAIVAWLATLIAQALFILLTLFVVRPYLFEAFTTPANSMAPTLLGLHWESPCPRCGFPAFATPDREDVDSWAGPVLMICSRERKLCEVTKPPHAVLPGDRFVVNKLITPQRWDVIAFRSPEDPETNYVKRLVGLPGERVVIHDGAVWINGERQTPLDSCEGLEYLDRIESWPYALWGSTAKPVHLGPDEYFVLGDFSAKSKDSRLWQQGAPGHPPYAVPASYIVGVVTHIYWPRSRWAVLR